MPSNASSQRNDPYRNFKFRIKWDGNYVAGLSKCSALKKSTEVVNWREAGDNSTGRKLPAKTSYEPITLEAGVTLDTAFEEWADKVNNYEGDSAMSLDEFRKDFITLDVFDLQNNKVLSYAVYNCWISEYQALPELDASGNAVMIQTVKIENEGWQKQPV
jgi:phage tail-like protein